MGFYEGFAALGEKLKARAHTRILKRPKVCTSSATVDVNSKLMFNSARRLCMRPREIVVAFT